MYKVIKYFEDLQDNRQPYNEGDIFPREGLNVSEERLAELSSTNNRRKIKLIELVDDGEGEKPTKTKINSMKVDELKELAIANGIENADTMNGVQLKEVLIAHFEL